MLHELGSERREAVWSLSFFNDKNWKSLNLVREDRFNLTTSLFLVL